MQLACVLRTVENIRRAVCGNIAIAVRVVRTRNVGSIRRCSTMCMAKTDIALLSSWPFSITNYNIIICIVYGCQRS